MRSPYSNLPARNFWKSGVAEQNPLTITGLYKKKFAIEPDCKIATAGSCFAQHIGRYLRRLNFNVIDAEPAPPGFSMEMARTSGYNTYSARYGNIYVVRQLLQLAQEAYGVFTPRNMVWEKDGRFYDALRPSVEPHGLKDAASVMRHREEHLKRVRQVLETADLFIFTLGLTEAWVDADSDTVYPTAPGTIAGDLDAQKCRFKNFSFAEIYRDFIEFRLFAKERNPKIKFLLTVSPVPLTATASANHVLTATTYSKSVLRAVAGQLYDEFDDVEYFPSYELVASPFSRGFFFEPNLRSVSEAGVAAVMRVFLAEHQPARAADGAAPERTTAGADAENEAEDVVCEDILLEAFAR